uniref:Hypothetical secreted protein n=1 Tax=Simulium nigrimanum TaxID=683695 RepID=D1FQ61_SIMNI
MLLSSIVILFGLCTTRISANAVPPNIDIKARLIDELQHDGVIMDNYCEFRLDAATFKKTAIAKDAVNGHVQQLSQDIEPLRKKINGLVDVLFEHKDAAVQIDSLVAALIEFSKTVLVNELQLLQNFELWILEDKTKVLNNTKCFNADHVEQMNNDMVIGCGNGELELDANKVCRSLIKFQTALNHLYECRDQTGACEAMHSKSESAITASLDEFESLYADTPEGLRSEEEKHALCLLLALSLTASDKTNTAHNYATCILDDLNQSATNQD